VLDYIRAGFKPQNTALHNAGAPDDGNPDIGAVDLVPVSVPFNTNPYPIINPKNTINGNQIHFNKKGLRIDWIVSDQQPLTLEIYSVTGRLLGKKSLSANSGVAMVCWKELPYSGNQSPPGPYFAKVTGPHVNNPMVMTGMQ
jgi:hypothetical protein